MQTRVKIGREYKTYDLSRVRLISQLKLRAKVVVIHPETSELCIARVVERRETNILVREISESIAPYQWRIYKKNISWGVYKIN